MNAPNDANDIGVSAHGRRHSSLARNVFYPAVVVMSLLVVAAILFPDALDGFIQGISSTLVNATGWYYVLVVAGLVIFAVVLAFSRKGDIVLGKDDDKPEHSRLSWFAMLFAAGMGIGLVFFGAAEPLQHFVDPHPGVSPEMAARARDAMATTFLHWGLSAWAIYVVVGLGVAYAVHRKGLPVSMRWAIVSLLGKKRTKGALGALIDIVAIVGTLIGVATSLGFGVMQLASGIEYLTGIHLSKTAIVVVAVVISALAAISVSSGLDRGIKFLSNANLVLALVFMLAVLFLGPTLFILNEFVQDVGYYLQNIVILSLRTMPFEGAAGADWMSAWTVYYWGWWISWSPFVGIFIARISRGRTIREFILGVMLVPTLVTFFWFAVMGGTTLYQQIFGADALVPVGGAVDTTTALFQMLATLPASKLLSGAAVILLVIFFVTSSDSGSYVMSMLSTGGNTNPRISVRLTWAVFTGAVATSLLAAGGSGMEGVAALQTLVVASALPMTAVLILMAMSLWKDLAAERELIVQRERRLMRSRLVEEAVKSVAAQLDEHASRAATNPIDVPSPLWRFPLLPPMPRVPKKPRAAGDADEKPARKAKRKGGLGGPGDVAAGAGAKPDAPAGGAESQAAGQKTTSYGDGLRAKADGSVGGSTSSADDVQPDGTGAKSGGKPEPHGE